MLYKYWPSPAKINLFLYITGINSNKYHNLQTLFQLIDYCDNLYFKINKYSDITISSKNCNIKKLNNLIFKSAHLLIKKAISKNILSKKTGVSILIDKRIPLSSGLGGGSSNAATTLLVLNKILKINFTSSQLMKIGLTLGADIPFFIKGHTAFAEGIGEKLTLVCLLKKWYLIVHPGIGISTKYVFCDPDLQRNTKKRSYSSIMQGNLSNDCEIIVRKNFFKFQKYILFLSKYAPFRMTGTGDCIFAEFDNKKDAHKILKKLPFWINSFIVKGVNISPLHNILNNY